MTKTIFAAESLLHEGQRSMTSERVVNMFAEAAPARLPVTLRSVPGLTDKGQMAAGQVAAFQSTENGLYAAVGTTLIRWDGNSFITIGTIPEGNTTMAWNGSDLAIAVDQEYHVWNGTTLARVEQGAFADIGSVDYIDGYIVRSEYDGQRHDITALNDATAISALDFASAEHRPDKISRVLVSGGIIWLMGDDSVEPWQNVGASDFPFARVSSTILEKGVRSTHEAARLDNTIFWNSNESRAYRQTNFQPQRISTHSVEASLDAHQTATSFAYQWQGHDFYVIRFSDRPAWVYDAATQSWHERTTGPEMLDPWEVTAAVHHEGKWYAGTADGNLAEFAGKQDMGNEIRREAVSKNQTNGGDRFVVNHVDVRCEAGTGGTVMTSYSSDGGRTFSNERHQAIGSVGNYDQRLQLHALGQHREFCLKVACTDNVDFAIYEAGIS